MNTDFSVSFAGRQIIHPGAYDKMDASQMVITSSGTNNIPVILGEALAGKPGEVKWFTDAGVALTYLRGGELSDAVQMMMSPSSEGGGGASTVGVIVTNTTVQAKLEQGNLLVTSSEYGVGGNKIQAKLENGTIAGTKKFTAYRWDTEDLETYDNLGAIFRISYTGESAWAGIEIVTADVGGHQVPTTIKTYVGENAETATVDITLDLSSDRYSTIDSIVRYFNSVSNYSASYNSFDSVSLSSTSLDAVTKTQIPEGGYQLLGLKADIEARINKYSSLAVVEVKGALTNFDFLSLSGGSAGVSPVSWSKYFNLLKTQFSDMLIVLSSSITIQAEALTHINQMELRNQKQVLFTGGGLGETSEQIIQRATNFNSSRAVVGYPGIYHKVNGGTQAMPSYMTSALIAGRVAGVDPSEPITFDYFNVIGLENDLIAGDPEIDNLIANGVATLERVQNGGIRLAQGVTTYTGQNNVLYREICVRRGADALSEDVRRTLEETFIGKKGIVGILTSVESKAKEVLDAHIKKGTIVAYQNVVAKQVGTVIYVDFEAAPTQPVNFILITTHFVPEITA